MPRRGGRVFPRKLVQMNKHEALLITGNNLKTEAVSDFRKPYYMSRHEASIHLWAMGVLEPTSALEKEDIEEEKERMRDYYEMRWG